MDLSEIRESQGKRHPWELARAKAAISILDRFGPRRVERLLDFGCGDGFTGRQIAEHLGGAFHVGLDVHLTPAQCEEFSKPGRASFVRDASEIEGSFDLALLCDVIEHVEDDVAVLSQVRDWLAPEGMVLVTVPAFQQLFSSHDRALRHHRRYTREGLERSVESAGFEVIESGYLFASLLLPRVATVLAERARAPKESDGFGVGAWNGGALLTALLTRALELDNALLLSGTRRGLTLPGLSTWAIARKRS